MKWCIALPLLLIPLIALADEVTTRDGKSYSGRVSFVDDKIGIQTATTNASINISDLQRFTSSAATQPAREPLHGLKAEYFDNVDLKNIVLTRLEHGLQLGWYDGIPGPGVPNHFSARWSGFLTAPYSETYAISVEHDDGVRIWIDDKLVLDQWAPGHKHDGCSVAMKAMTPTPIRIEMFNEKDAASLDVRWSSSSLPAELVPLFRLTPPADFDPATIPVRAKDSSHGVLAEFYPNKNLQGILLTRIDPAISFDFHCGSPGLNVGRDFAVHWCGYLTPPKTETYEFTTDSRGGARLWVDGKLVVDNWHPSHTYLSGSIALEASKPVMISVAYYDDPQDGYAQLFWSSPHMKRQVISTDYLTPATVEQRRAEVSSHGLRAEYFADDSFQNRLVMRRDARLNFLWYANDISSRPDPLVPEKFGARWTGFLTPPRDGEYTIFNTADDAGRVYLDGKLLLDKWHARSGEYSAKVQLSGGKKYELKIELSNREGRACTQVLAWAGPGIEKQVIDTQYLSPPAGDPPSMPELKLNFINKDYYSAGEAIAMSAEGWVDPADHIKRVDFYADGKIARSFAKPPFAMEFKDLPPGNHRLGVRLADDSDYVTAPSPVDVIVSSDLPGNLHEDWTDVRIGPGALEAIKANGEICTATATPGEIWSAADDFRFVFRPMEGDGQVIVRINSLSADTPGTVPAAGIMIRDGLSTGARHVSLMLCGSGNDLSATFVHRDLPNRESQVMNGLAAKTPLWLKLVRTGHRVDSFVSSDAIHWSAAGGMDVDFPAKIFAGFAVVSKGDGKATTTFDRLSAHPGRPAAYFDVPGLQMKNGTFLAGELREADAQTLRFFYQGKDLKVNTAEVAKVLFAPLPVDVNAALVAGHQGLILRTGDFAEGDFLHFRDRFIGISSVLFGEQNFSAGGDAIGIVFHDAEPVGKYQITATDGSVYRTDSVEVNASRIRFKDATLGELKLKIDELSKIEIK